MVKSTNYIKFFSIISSAGSPYFALKIDDNLDENLISGLLSAIYAMGKASLDEQISKISVESGNSRVDSFIQKNEDGSIRYIAFGLVSMEFSHRDFNMFAEKVIFDFHERYGEMLPNWKGNLDAFSGFENYIVEMIEKHVNDENEMFNTKLDELFNQIQNGDLSGLDDLQ